MNSRTRPAFTLIEVLVVFALLAFALGLLLPLVQMIRQTASRTASQNNLKMLGIGCHTYHDAHKKFPPGVDANGFATHAHILPYLEQENIWKKIQFNVPARAQANDEVRKLQVVIAVFLSPMDPLSSTFRPAGPTNYLFSAGTNYSLDKNNGPFYRESKTSMVDITDGTSNTVMAGETLLGDGSDKATDVKRQHVELSLNDLAMLTEVSGVQNFANNQNIAGNRGHTWLEGKFLQGLFTGTRLVNEARPDVNCGGGGGLSALRGLEKGVNILLCDGSTRFLSETTNMNTWKAMCTRDGGEVVNIP